MKKFWKRSTAFALTFVMIASPLHAFASIALGDDLRKTQTQIHDGTTYVQQTFYSNTYKDLRREEYVIYEPNAAVKPVVSYGDYILERITTKTAAERLEKGGDVRVIAGMNGDFFGISSGMPLGSIVTDGILRVGLRENYAIGFYPDGTAVLGLPNLQMRAEILKAERETAQDTAASILIDFPQDEPVEQAPIEELLPAPVPFDIAAVNCVRYSYGGIYLYSRDFNSRRTVGTNEPGVDVVCSVQDGELAIGQSVTLRVEQVLEHAVDTAVPEGCLVFSANDRAGDAFTAPLRALRAGDELSVSVRAEDEKWNGVKELMGALYLLVQDGKVQSGLETAQAPRSAIGQRADGSLIFYTIDGRQSGLSVGAGVDQVAKRLVELGCVTAVGLDGGGSTTMLCAYPAGEKAETVNSPSDGSLRKVTDSVLLVASTAATGQAAHIALAAQEETVLPGAKTAVFCRVLDTNFLPVSGAPTVTASDGTLEGGVFTAPQTAGDVTLTATYEDITQSTVIHVISAPESVSAYADGALIGDTLNLAGGQSVALTASALYKHLPINADSLPVSWSADGAAGTVSGSVFTADEAGGMGTITLRCGTLEKKIVVYVTAKPLCTLADFEEPFEAVSSADGKLQMTQNTARGFVRYGLASAKLHYALASGETSVLPVSYGIPEGYDGINLQISGDARDVAFALQTDRGVLTAQLLTSSDWTQVSFRLPEGTKTVTGLLVQSAADAAGDLYLDQIVATYDEKRDADAPEASFAVRGNKITATVRDAVDGGNIALSLTANGKSLFYAYDEAAGLLTAQTPDTATLCRITLLARDASGNLARWSDDVEAKEIAAAFTDTQKHWANGYVAWLKEAGITNGDGAGRYHPDDAITREEFAALLCRYLCAQTQMPETKFADDKAISDWAKESIYTLCAMGVIQGSEEGGKLYCNPKANISRQEAVTMLSRLLPQGYTTGQSEFADAGTIAAWAKDAVVLLSSLGVLTGDADGGFHPNDSLTRAQTAAVLYRMQ